MADDLADAPGGAQSVAERAPRTRGVALIGFVTVALLCAAFVYTLVRVKPANVPRGLLGLRFGMSESDVRAEIAGLVPASPGTLEGPARVFDLPARCAFSFAGEHGLSSIQCAVDDSENHQRAKKRIVATLRQLYGEETAWDGSDDERWIWRGRHAELRVTASREPPALRVQNDWRR